MFLIVLWQTLSYYFYSPCAAILLVKLNRDVYTLLFKISASWLCPPLTSVLLEAIANALCYRTTYYFWDLVPRPFTPLPTAMDYACDIWDELVYYLKDAEILNN